MNQVYQLRWKHLSPEFNFDLQHIHIQILQTELLISLKIEFREFV